MLHHAPIGVLPQLLEGLDIVICFPIVFHDGLFAPLILEFHILTIARAPELWLGRLDKKSKKVRNSGVFKLLDLTKTCPDLSRVKVKILYD